MHHQTEYDLNYVALVSLYYPTKQIKCIGSPALYQSIVWSDNVPITQTDLHDKYITRLKVLKTDDLNELCEETIRGGCTSSALGSPHWYDMEEVDQINAIGSLLSTLPTPGQPNGGTTMYACKDVITKAKLYKLHTYAQMAKLVTDGVQFKLSCLQHVFEKRMEVANSTTKEQILAINW
jgi:hypothetical protein